MFSLKDMKNLIQYGFEPVAVGHLSDDVHLPLEDSKMMESEEEHKFWVLIVWNDEDEPMEKWAIFL